LASRCDGERAADPLHRAWIDAKTLGDAAYAFTSVLTLVQSRLDLLSQVWRLSEADQVVCVMSVSAPISRRSIRWPRALFMGEAVGAVVLVTAKTVRLSIWACAWRRQWVAAEEALEFSQGFPGWR
jgi:hypothetical protein